MTFNAKELSELFGVTQAQISYWINEGILKCEAANISKRTRYAFTHEEIKEFFEAYTERKLRKVNAWRTKLAERAGSV